MWALLPLSIIESFIVYLSLFLTQLYSAQTPKLLKKLFQFKKKWLCFTGLEHSESQRALKWHPSFKIYGDFAEWMDFAFKLSRTGKGLQMCPTSSRYLNCSWYWVNCVWCTICKMLTVLSRVQCSLCGIQGAVYSVPCSLYSVQYEMYRGAVYSVQCTVGCVQCTVCHIQWTVCSDRWKRNPVQSTMCSVQCTICTVYCEVNLGIFPNTRLIFGMGLVTSF